MCGGSQAGGSQGQGPNFNDPGFQQFLQTYQPQSGQPQSGQPQAAGDPTSAFRQPQPFNMAQPTMGDPTSAFQQPQQQFQQFQPQQQPPQMQMSDPGFQNYMKGTGIDPNSAAGQAMFQNYAKTGPQSVQAPPPAQGPGDNSMGSAYYNANPMGGQQLKGGIVNNAGPNSTFAPTPTDGTPLWLYGPTAGLLGSVGKPSDNRMGWNPRTQQWGLDPMVYSKS